MTYSLDLLFLESSEKQVVGGPIAQLCVKTHTSDGKGNILITPRCVSFGEVVEQLLVDSTVDCANGGGKDEEICVGRSS